MSRVLSLLSSLLSISVFVLPAALQATPITFTAVGCGPYLPKDEEAVTFYMKQENVEATSKFIVHLGDLISGTFGRLLTDQPTLLGGLMESRKMYLLKDNKIPTYVVPGDNEWNDVENHAMAWKNWASRFEHFEKNWPGSTPGEPDPAVAGNFRFNQNGVLFIGINLPGGRTHDSAEWAKRLPANAAWIAGSMASAAGKASRAAVIFAQANPLILLKSEPKRFDVFLEPMRAAATAYSKPVLFLHADGHKWTDDFPWPEKNLRRVQLDLWNTKFPSAQVTVKDTGDASKIFEFNRRLKDPKWLFLKEEPAGEPGDAGKPDTEDKKVK